MRRASQDAFFTFNWYLLVNWSSVMVTMVQDMPSLPTPRGLPAQDARMVQADEKQFARVTRRLEALLKKDVENQEGRAAAARKLAEFQRDPRAWLESNLNPRLGEPVPKGYEVFSNATNDWSQWVPPQ